MMPLRKAAAIFAVSIKTWLLLAKIHWHMKFLSFTAVSTYRMQLMCYTIQIRTATKVYKTILY